MIKKYQQLKNNMLKHSVLLLLIIDVFLVKL
jgi:hypothetical protein